MSCQFLCGRQVKMCGAFNGAVVLSMEELTNFCSSPLHDRCKTYQKFIHEGNKLPLTDYSKGYILPSV